jgi:hypothetical protein
MKMAKTFGALAIPLVLTFAGPRQAVAQKSEEPEKKEWSLTGSYKSGKNTMLRFQRKKGNTYGFFDIFGDKCFNLQSFYGEFRARKSLGKGFSLGAEYNGGTGIKDKIRLHGSYTRKFGPLLTDVKFSPVETSLEDGMELGVYTSAEFGPWSLSGWVDFGMDYDFGNFRYKGEAEASRKFADNAYVIGRIEKYPWQEGPVYSIGLKANF